MEMGNQSLPRLGNWYKIYAYVCCHIIFVCMLVVIFTCTSTFDSLRAPSQPKTQVRPTATSGHPQPVKAEDGTHLLVDRDRTLWMAGWNARFFQYYNDVPPTISWTVEAEDYVDKAYRRLHFPRNCAAAKGFMVTHVYEWGVTSAIRDYQSDILRAMALNYTLVHEGEYNLCPGHPERYLNCFWNDFTGCQATWHGLPSVPVFNQTQGVTTAPVTPDEFPDWLWDALYRGGWVRIRDGETGKDIREDEIPNREQYFQLKVSVLRAILSKKVFRPRAHIRARTDEVLQAWQAANKTARDGVVIHIRRTDKMIDLGPHWRHIEFGSVKGVGMLIETMEARLNRTFGHAVVMSDDPKIQLTAFEDLAGAFQSSPEKLTSKQLCDLLGAHQSEYQGHETLSMTDRNTLYDIVISEMYAAAHVSDYIIGSGSCGVSQFIARLIGAKHFVEPSLIGLWEEDIVVQECSWILQQRRRISSSCTPSGAVSGDTVIWNLQQRMLEEEWVRKDCSSFSVQPPDCLAMKATNERP